MRFALLSDLHCWSVNLLPWRLMGKRAVGMSNLIMFRMNRFSKEVVERNVKRVAELDFDHVLFTGDATQTSLLSEFRKAKHIFEPIRNKLLAIPGNHDRYTTGTLIYKRFERIFLDMPKFPKNVVNNTGRFDFNAYPWVKNTDSGVKIIGLNCAYPSFQAFGIIKPKQLDLLEAQIDEANKNGLKLIILNHFQYAYPQNVKPKSSHTLYNSEKLIEVLNKAKKAIYVHGHIHKPWIMMPEVTPNILCISAISSGMRLPAKPFGLGFYELKLDGNDVIVNKHLPTSEDAWEVEQQEKFDNFWS